MAELLILLVFCLLLAVGANLAFERQKKDEAIREVGALRDRLAATQNMIAGIKDNSRLGELLSRGAAASNATIDEFWQKLVAGYETAQTLERNGLSMEEARASAAFLAEAEALKKSGKDLREIVAKADIADKIAAALAKNDVPIKDPERISALIENGIKAEAQEGEGGGPSDHSWPPIISLSEAGGYFFAKGSAELSPQFEQRLKSDVIPLLVETARKFGVDVVEVVGHTDELPIGTRPSNLDRDLPSVLRGNAPVGVLKPADNAGLGLARSVSVVKNLIQDSRMEGLRVLPLSGAQLIQTDETLTRGGETGDVQQRRRIEIRLRKSSEGQQASVKADRTGSCESSNPALEFSCKVLRP
jgi:flagellar motor protein MotB